MVNKNIQLEDNHGFKIFPITTLQNVKGLLEFIKIIGKIEELKTQEKSNIVDSINEVLSIAKDNSHIDNEINNIQNNIDEYIKQTEDNIEKEIKGIEEYIGKLDYLETENKESIVSSINELISNSVNHDEMFIFEQDILKHIKKIGSLELLKTKDKSNIVNSINELHNSLNSLVEEDFSSIFNDILNKITEIRSDIGNLDSLKTDSNTIVDSINELFLSTPTSESLNFLKEKIEDIGSIEDLITENKEDIVSSINELHNNIVKIDNISTNNTSDIRENSKKISQNIKDIEDLLINTISLKSFNDFVLEVGKVESLKTNDSSSIVNAINEINDITLKLVNDQKEIIELKKSMDKIGDLSQFSKDNNLVKYINEIINDVVKKDELNIKLKDLQSMIKQNSDNIGPLSLLKTKNKDTIVSSINNLVENIAKIDNTDEVEKLISEIGDLDLLNSENKDNIVNSINSVLDKIDTIDKVDDINKIIKEIGDISNLKTEERDNIVNSINSLMDSNLQEIYHVGFNPPSNQNLIWIDLNENDIIPESNIESLIDKINTRLLDLEMIFERVINIPEEMEQEKENINKILSEVKGLINQNNIYIKQTEEKYVQELNKYKTEIEEYKKEIIKNTEELSKTRVYSDKNRRIHIGVKEPENASEGDIWIMI